jgi:hypothetical protein
MLAQGTNLAHPAARKQFRPSRAALVIWLLAILLVVPLYNFGSADSQKVSLIHMIPESVGIFVEVVRKKRMLRANNVTRSSVLADVGTCSDWAPSNTEWNASVDVLRLAAQYGFRPQTFSQLQPISQRIAFVKIHKTGSTTFSSMIYNGASRRRNLVLVRKQEDTCRVRINIPVNMKSPPSPVAVDFTVNHIIVKHAHQLARPTLLIDWYEKQMNGPNGEGVRFC